MRSIRTLLGITAIAAALLAPAAVSSTVADGHQGSDVAGWSWNGAPKPLGWSWNG